MNLDPEKLLMLMAIGLLVLGPQRLPQVAKGLGHFMGEVKKYRAMLDAEMGDLLGSPRRASDLLMEKRRAITDATRQARATAFSEMVDRGLPAPAPEASALEATTAPVPDDATLN